MTLIRKIITSEGNTLFNILVTLGIIVLLSTISIPYLKKYQPNIKLNAAARELTSNLRYAQQLTITEQVVYSVAFDITNNSYEIIKNNATTTDVIKTIIFPTDVNFQQITGITDNEVFFNSYGGVNESGGVILENINGKTTNINIKPSGYIQLQQQ